MQFNIAHRMFTGLPEFRRQLEYRPVPSGQIGRMRSAAVEHYRPPEIPLTTTLPKYIGSLPNHSTRLYAASTNGFSARILGNRKSKWGTKRT
jgi:hypothetical protein